MSNNSYNNHSPLLLEDHSCCKPAQNLLHTMSHKILGLSTRRGWCNLDTLHFTHKLFDHNLRLCHMSNLFHHRILYSTQLVQVNANSKLRHLHHSLHNQSNFCKQSFSSTFRRNCLGQFGRLKGLNSNCIQNLSCKLHIP
jgi:hypothetical protein